MTHDMYQQNILDHARQPRNFHDDPKADGHAHRANPLCGDEVDFFLKYGADGKVTEASFTGRGCAISQAAASMLTEKVRGLTKEEIIALNDASIKDLLGVQVNPARQTCATWGLLAAKDALAE